MVRFVIPAYNEADNVARLLADLTPRAHALGARVIFVDDGSSDDTSAAIEAARDGLHLTILRHTENRGLGTALNTGLRAALSEAHDDDAIVTIESDNTSDLDDLPGCSSASTRATTSFSRPSMRRAARSSACRATACWRPGSSRRRFATLAGYRYPHAFVALRVYRAGTLRRAAETYGYLLVREPGFAANVELLLKLYNAGAKVAEVPTVNDWRRRAGVSKLKLTPTVLAYGRLAAAHLVGRIQPPPISPLSGREE